MKDSTVRKLTADMESENKNLDPLMTNFSALLQRTTTRISDSKEGRFDLPSHKRYSGKQAKPSKKVLELLCRELMERM